MSRARLIVQEITIRKQGEVSFFQIRLPKNAVRLIGIETDVFMLSALETASIEPTIPSQQGGHRDNTTVNRTPVLSWTNASNAITGKLKLQSLDRYNVFFEAWVPFVLLNGGLPDMSYGLFAKSPYSLITTSLPRTINIPCSSTILNGVFIDSIGLRRKIDLSYIVKIFVWVQTTEKDQGVQYDFQNKNITALEVKL